MPVRIAIVAPNDLDLIKFRLPLIKKLIQEGMEVLAITPLGPYGERLEEMGCRVVFWPLERRSLNPLKEIASLVALYRIYRTWRPTIAHHFTIKPNIYGTLAARLARVPLVALTITGLGYFWAEQSWRTRLGRQFLEALYRFAIRKADVVFFMNEDDRRILGDGKLTRLWRGEGVDIEAFHPKAIPSEQLQVLRCELGIKDGAQVVLLAARMLWHKGVAEFVEAARRIRKERADAVFFLAGPIDKRNPAFISEAQIRAWEAEGLIRYLGFQEDLRGLLALSTLLVLPSYYREGVPQVLLEGAAMGKPLIATDVPGCREAVRHGVNGFLVPPRDPEALAEAIRRLLDDPEQRVKMGQASRTLAEQEFSAHRQVAQVIEVYQLLLDKRGKGG